MGSGRHRSAKTMRKTPMPPRKKYMRQESPKRAGKRNPRIGSTLGSFLREEGIADAVAKRAVEKIVHSTTTKTTAAPQSKAGRFECRALLDFHKRGTCAGCGQPADDPSHYPSRGAGGDDLGCYPICRPCHGEAQQYRGKFTREWQELEAGRALVRFIRNATTAERHSMMAAWEAYAAGRAWQEMVTF